MKIIGLRHLEKLKKKNQGNSRLIKAIDLLISDLSKGQWQKKEDVLAARNDADCVHDDGFYFFDIQIHRTMVLIEYSIINPDDDDLSEVFDGRAQILWAGSHDDYERTFKNNKNTIATWLRNQGLID